MPFEIGQLVLAKVPSYSKWPAVVVPEDKIPSEVLKVKNNKSYCVFFFGNDPSFFWGDEKSISPLDISVCEKQAKKAKGLIKQAYQHAADHSSDFLSVLETSIDENTNNDIENEEEEPEVEEELEQEEEADYEEEEEEEEVKPKKTKRKTAPKTLKRKSKTSSPALEDETKKLKKEEPAAHLSWSDEEKYKHFWFIRTKLQKGLISRPDPPSSDELQLYSNVMSKLESLNSDNIVDFKVLKTTKLHKVLKAIIKLDRLQRPDDFKFHERCAKLLNAWSPLIIAVKEEKMTREGSPADKKNGINNGLSDTKNGDKIDKPIIPKKEETTA